MKFTNDPEARLHTNLSCEHLASLRSISKCQGHDDATTKDVEVLVNDRAVSDILRLTYAVVAMEDRLTKTEGQLTETKSELKRLKKSLPKGEGKKSKK